MSENQLIYLIFAAVLLLAIIFDLGFISKKNTKMTMKTAFWQSVFWVVLALGFWIFIWSQKPDIVATKYITAYLMEKSLSIDNIFVFILIFSYFKVDELNASRALFVGILLAIVFRIAFIALGVELLDRFHWLLYIFGAFLVYTGVKLFAKQDEQEFNPNETMVYKVMNRLFRVAHDAPSGRYFITRNQKIFITPLLIVVVMLAATDVVFAVDSIPTVVSLVRENAQTPFTPDDIMVIYSSNIFAVLGLRSLFFLLRGAADEFDYLQQGIAIVLVFIGLKMLVEFFGIHISIYLSLVVILLSIGGSIWYSHYHRRKGVPKVKE